MVRRDLPQPHLTVQAIHAAIAATHTFGAHPCPHVVLCSVENERQLLDLFNGLKEQGVPCCSMNEPDFVGDPMTAIATAPLAGKQREPLRKLPLFH